MASRLLYLVFPQWQGSGKRKYVYDGAAFIRDRLLGADDHEEVKVSQDESIKLEKGIWGYRQIFRQLVGACDVLKRKKPEKIFLIGGDCGTEVAPVSYLNKRYGGDMAVIWLDAHGDLNVPGSSPSNNFHGMPLRCLLGEGERSLLDESFSILRPRQVVMCGTRDLDPPEAAYIEKSRISVLTVEDVEGDVERLPRLIEEKGFHNVYVHIDLDVLDSGKCPWALCLTPDGMSTTALMALLRSVRARFNIVGASVVEFRPVDDMDTGPLTELIKFCKDI